MALVGGAAWVGLGGVVLLEEVHHWGRAERFKVTQCHSQFTLCPMFWIKV